jgi:ferredoxin-type protein NapH
MQTIQINIDPHEESHSGLKKAGLSVFAVGMLFFLISFTSVSKLNPILFFILSIVMASVGGLIFFYGQYKENPIAGVKNNGVFFLSATNKGLLGWVTAVFFTGFYICLYWFPEVFGNFNSIFDWLSYTIRNKPSDQWFMYGTLYTLAVLIMGVRMIVHKRQNKYQIIRTISVIFFQLFFGFLIPGILAMFNEPEYYFSYFWPLKYDYLFPGNFQSLMNSPGQLAMFMFFWSTMMSFVAVPVLTYYFGKRWYCSWVCGCGALAETLGDPYRHLSDKSLKSWKYERWIIYSVLVAIVLLTALLWINSYYKGEVLGEVSYTYSKIYGFVIGAGFAGVAGVGFYPLMGARVWCRFGCPLAAILGIFQKYFSRFRITTNGGQCISCGNCSTYCEMGIDVKSYAQRGQNIIRASCVGCGVCSEVCPRGVLKLENGPTEGRYELNDEYLR